MRKLVGHRPLILPAAGAIILDDRRRVLLQLRSDDGTWGITGGAMEPGETLEESVRLEFHDVDRLPPQIMPACVPVLKDLVERRP